MEPIAIQAIFGKATTMVDGSWRFSFDSAENQGPNIAKIAGMRGTLLYVVIMTEDQFNKSTKPKGR